MASVSTRKCCIHSCLYVLCLHEHVEKEKGQRKGLKKINTINIKKKKKKRKRKERKSNIDG